MDDIALIASTEAELYLALGIYGSILCRFWDIQCRKMSRPWNPGPRSLNIIESGTIR